jgi:uncharacterized protein
MAQAPSVHVSAQEKPSAPTPTAKKPAAQAQAPASETAVNTGKDAGHVDPAKVADIRQLMEVTGAKNLGDQLMKAGMEQFRANVTESQPNNPRATQFADAFVARFQQHFDPNAVTEQVIPIYDKYLSAEDIKGLLEYYRSPLGQRMLKVLPEVARDSQMAGYTIGQKAAEQAMEDLRKEYPEFVSNEKDDEKRPGPEKKE